MFGRKRNKFNNAINPVDTDTGTSVYPDFSQGLHTDEYPMRSYNNSMVPARNRQAPSTDKDVLPHQFRRFVNASGVQDAQLINGLQNGIASGRRINYAGAGYLYAVVPRIPGQTRGDAAGFHKKGPSPLNVQALWEAGPGSQPSNPGGPGRIAAPVYINPMSG
jgi:hypothetical protein